MLKKNKQKTNKKAEYKISDMESNINIKELSRKAKEKIYMTNKILCIQFRFPHEYFIYLQSSRSVHFLIKNQIMNYQ